MLQKKKKSKSHGREHSSRVETLKLSHVVHIYISDDDDEDGDEDEEDCIVGLFERPNERF